MEPSLSPSPSPLTLATTTILPQPHPTLPPHTTPPPPLLSQYERTALLLSARYGHDACLKVLLEAGADITAKTGVREGWGAVLAVAREVAVVGWW